MSDGLLGAGRIRALLDEVGARPSKSLGQNFVIDPNTIRKMVELSGVSAGEHVLEIGAGTGALTLGLLARGARVTALEIDRRLIPALERALTGSEGVTVVEGDATRFDYASVGATRLVGNLPYNLAANIVVSALERGPSLVSLTVMTQREVGERLAASPGNKVYGLTSVLVAFHGQARIVGKVSRKAFFPVPRVDSVIVRIDRRTALDVPWEEFAGVVRAAFAHRRKMLRNVIAPLVGSGSEASRVLERAGLDPEARAEEVDCAGFVALTSLLSSEEGTPES